MRKSLFLIALILISHISCTFNKYYNNDSVKTRKQQSIKNNEESIINFDEVKINFKESPLLNKKWIYANVSVNGKEYPPKIEERNNYFIFKEANQLEEMKSGKIVKGKWEYMPYGKLIILFSEDRSSYYPTRIVKLTQSELWLQIFSLELMTMIIIKYDSGSIY